MPYSPYSRRIVGGLLMAYAVVYLMQYVGSSFYDSPQRVWDVFNVVSAIAIVVALVVNVRSVRDGVDIALLCANAVLAVWFLHVWTDLLTLAEGESVSVHHDVVWEMVAAMMPIVLGVTGLKLLRRDRSHAGR